jgi:hypothetical protein
MEETCKLFCTTTWESAMNDCGIEKSNVVCFRTLQSRLFSIWLKLMHRLATPWSTHGGYLGGI